MLFCSDLVGCDLTSIRQRAHSPRRTSHVCPVTSGASDNSMFDVRCSAFAYCQSSGLAEWVRCWRFASPVLRRGVFRI